MLWNVFAISISLSLDALGIGISYKLKGVQISLVAKILIGIVSMLVMWGALSLGSLMLVFFPSKVANIIGITILAIIGLSFIRNGLFGTEEAIYDFNKSKKIDLWEAAILGVALSADSVSAGIAVSTIGLSSYLIPFTVGIMQVVFLSIGDRLLDRVKILNKVTKKACGVFSGVLLLMIALLRMFA